MTTTIPADIIGKMREAAIGLRKSAINEQIVEPRDAVLARFQPVFSPERAGQISPEEFRSFLLFENNRHWTGLHRQGTRMCENMGKLRKALGILADESQQIADRLDLATNMVPGMGKNIASAILLIMNPNRYGVWNNRSEANMKQMGIWPEFDRGESFGSRYVKVNQVLLQLRDALDIDLWALDAIWWYMDKLEEGDLGQEEVAEPQASIEAKESCQYFGLERHLHEFLRDNWDRLELGREWEIYKEPGDDEAGYEYPCEVGRIDLLAKHRSKPLWLVIELKRNQTSDQTMGQLLRYIGWVKRNLAEDGEQVQGLIICHEADDGLKYALSTQTGVELRLYRVEFRLISPDALGEKKPRR